MKAKLTLPIIFAFSFKCIRSRWRGRRLHWTTWRAWEPRTSLERFSMVPGPLNVSSQESLITLERRTRSFMSLFSSECWCTSWASSRPWSSGTTLTTPALSLSRRWGLRSCSAEQITNSTENKAGLFHFGYLTDLISVSIFVRVIYFHVFSPSNLIPPNKLDALLKILSNPTIVLLIKRNNEQKLLGKGFFYIW